MSFFFTTDSPPLVAEKLQSQQRERAFSCEKPPCQVSGCTSTSDENSVRAGQGWHDWARL